MSFDLPATMVFCFVTIFTPGPNNILSGSIGAFHGYRRAVPFITVLSTGLLTVMTFCALFSGFLTTRLPAVLPYLRYVGAAYILWLAWGVYRGGMKSLDDAEATEPLGFRRGYALQFLNPKAIVFGLTVATVFFAPILDSAPGQIGVPILLAVITFAANSTWALGGLAIGRFVGTPRRARILGAALAAMLVWTAVQIAGATT